MKKLNYCIMLLVAILTMTWLAACSDNNEEGRKVTNYKEYTLMVACKTSWCCNIKWQ